MSVRKFVPVEPSPNPPEIVREGNQAPLVPGAEPKAEPNPAPLKLNLGAGGTEIPGFINLDRKTGQEIYPLQYPDNSVDEIRASHVLEHFSHTQALAVLKDWVAKLRPGGMMKIAVPDFMWICEQYLAGGAIPLQGYLMGGQVDDNDYHKCIFDRLSLHKAMADAGLERIRGWKGEIQDCASLPVSLNLCGYKPISDKQVWDRFAHAILSAPRFGPTMHWQRSAAAFMAVGVNYSICQGAYWHQVLSKAIDQERKKYPYIIVCDYDSIFRPNDVTELIRLMYAYPELDILFPMQFKRNENALLGVPGRKVMSSEFSADVIPMLSGHFGLTCIRSEIFEKLSKPWFLPIPNADGEWDNGKTDADMYFWDNAREAGINIHMAPNIRVGHLQETIVWPDRNGQPVYQLADDYNDVGVPLEIP